VIGPSTGFFVDRSRALRMSGEQAAPTEPGRGRRDSCPLAASGCAPEDVAPTRPHKISDAGFRIFSVMGNPKKKPNNLNRTGVQQLKDEIDRAWPSATVRKEKTTRRRRSEFRRQVGDWRDNLITAPGPPARLTARRSKIAFA